MGGMMQKICVPKTEQLNADDLIGGDIVVTITAIDINESRKEQPMWISVAEFQRYYKPCLSMRRIMLEVWGGDEKAYIGRKLRLFRDPSAAYGGTAVGGIRISEMSHIDRPVVTALTVKRGQRAAYTVKPLAMPGQQPQQRQTQQPAAIPADLLADANEIAARGAADLRAWWEGSLTKDQRATLQPELARLKSVAAEADRVRAENATFGLDLPTPEQLAAEAAALAEIEAQRAAMEGGAE